MKKNKVPTMFVLVHAESNYNKRRIFTGWINSQLSLTGVKKAKQLAKWFKNIRLDLAIHSSLSRSIDTLKYILKYHPNTKIKCDDRIIERGYGKLSGKSKDKYQREHPKLFQIYHRSFDVAPPGGESIKQVEKRVLPFLKELITTMKEKQINVVVVAHSNSVRPIIRFFEKLTPLQIMKVENINSKIYKYKIL